MHLEPENIRSFLLSHRRRRIDDPSLRKAAVLILFYTKDQVLHVLLTKRTSIVEHHKGLLMVGDGEGGKMAVSMYLPVPAGTPAQKTE